MFTSLNEAEMYLCEGGINRSNFLEKKHIIANRCAELLEEEKYIEHNKMLCAMKVIDDWFNISSIKDLDISSVVRKEFSLNELTNDILIRKNDMIVISKLIRPTNVNIITGSSKIILTIYWIEDICNAIFKRHLDKLLFADLMCYDVANVIYEYVKHTTQTIIIEKQLNIMSTMNYILNFLLNMKINTNLLTNAINLEDIEKSNSVIVIVNQNFPFDKLDKNFCCNIRKIFLYEKLNSNTLSLFQSADIFYL